MHVIMLGAPGSGKGTLAGNLSSEEGYVHISTGELLREAMEKKTKLGLLVSDLMNSGQLVADDIVLKLVLEKVTGLKEGQGLVLDGYPRTVNQAKDLEKAFAKINISLDKAVYLEIDNDVVVKRLTGRRTCKGCSKIYHVEHMPPAVEGVCDVCGSELYTRSDDKEETILSRIAIYEKEIAGILEYYKQKDMLTVVDASGTKDSIYTTIKKILKMI